MVVKEASVIKVLHVIEPQLHPVIMINGSIVIEVGLIHKVDLSFTAGDIVFAKLRGLRLVPE
jgi:hypothetical protein